MRPSAKPRVKSARKRERVGLQSQGEEIGVAWRWAGIKKSEEVSERGRLSVEEDGETGEVSKVSALRGE